MVGPCNGERIYVTRLYSAVITVLDAFARSAAAANDALMTKLSIMKRVFALITFPFLPKMSVHLAFEGGG